jgi:hypothetical protein
MKQESQEAIIQNILESNESILEQIERDIAKFQMN